MFSNEFFVEDNNFSNDFNSWDPDQNTLFSSNKKDTPFNLFDEFFPIKQKCILPQNSFSYNASAETKSPRGDDFKQNSSDFDESLKKRKLFKVRKYVEYDQILKEIYSEGEEEQSTEEFIKTKNKLLNRKRISLREKGKTEDFSKLNQKEKVEKLSKLSKLVKRYRRKYACLQTKIKNNISKIFNKYLYEKLKINYKNKYLNHNLNLDLFTLAKGLRKLRSHNAFEYSDQKYALETLVNLLADNTLPLDSINFKKICTQIRLLLPKDKIKYINKKGSQITVQFPEKEVKITKKEYDTYRNFINNNDVLRRILGIKQDIFSQQTINPINLGNNYGLKLMPIIVMPANNQMFPSNDDFNGNQFFTTTNIKQEELSYDTNSTEFANKNCFVLLVPQQIDRPEHGPTSNLC